MECDRLPRAAALKGFQITRFARNAVIASGV